MFDFVRDIIDDGDEWSINNIINEMEDLIDLANEKLDELNNEDGNDEED